MGIEKDESERIDILYDVVGNAMELHSISWYQYQQYPLLNQRIFEGRKYLVTQSYLIFASRRPSILGKKGRHDMPQAHA